MLGVSVIIPVYNREKYINEAIQSVLDQDFDGNLEIIVSDDGSTDKTIEISESFGSPVHVLHKPLDCMNQGVSGARNRGILAATRPYICFLDSDDYYLPGHLQRMMEHLETNPGIGFAISRMYELKECDNKRHLLPWTAPKVTENDLRYLVLLRSRIVHTNVIIVRREIFTTVGLFNENYRNGEDGDMWMRISEVSKGVFLDHFGAAYRTDHGSGQLTSNAEKDIRNCSLQIFSAALNRYLDSAQQDRYRLFLIKKTIAGIESANSPRWRYYVQQLLLMFRYPISFVHYCVDYFSNKFNQ